jgi:hypothetical protein
MTVRDRGHTQEVLYIVHAVTCHVCRVCSDIRFHRFEWPLEREFEYVAEHIESWQKPQAMSPEDLMPNEEEDVQDAPPPPPEKPEKHSCNR